MLGLGESPTLEVDSGTIDNGTEEEQSCCNAAEQTSTSSAADLERTEEQICSSVLKLPAGGPPITIRNSTK